MTFSVPHCLQEQADHLTYIIRRCLTEDFTTIEATEAAEAAWQDDMSAVNKERMKFQEACTPGYFNAEGRVTAGDRRSAVSSGIYFPSKKFFDILAEWRAKGDFAGLHVT